MFPACWILSSLMFYLHAAHCGNVLGPARRSARLQEQRKAKESEEVSSPPSLSTEQQAAIHLAQRIMDKYFKGSFRKETESTKHLRALGNRLGDPSEDPKPLIQDILNTLCGDSISVFEFLESGVAVNIADFLVIDTKVGKGAADIDNALKRVRDLVSIGLVNGVDGGFRGLVRKLKHAVEASEKFPVRHVIGRSIRHPGPGCKSGEHVVLILQDKGAIMNAGFSLFEPRNCRF